MYLWHAPVIKLLEPYLHRVHDLGLGQTATLALCYAMVLAVVTLVAIISHSYIELPFLRLGNNIKRALAARRTGEIMVVRPDS
jgi:peptidoglycan/LPS O-acetylase OafA/YrhL